MVSARPACEARAGSAVVVVPPIRVPAGPRSRRIGRRRIVIARCCVIPAVGIIIILRQALLGEQLRQFSEAVQHQHPLILVGGAGKRMLSVAAWEADIIGFQTVSISRVLYPPLRPSSRGWWAGFLGGCSTDLKRSPTEAGARRREDIRMRNSPCTMTLFPSSATVNDEDPKQDAD